MSVRQFMQRLALASGTLMVMLSTALAAPVQVSEPGRRAISPEVAVAPNGTINVIWLDKGLTADRPAPKPRKPGEHSHRSNTDLYFSRSTDNGKSWSKPVRVNDREGQVWGFAVSKPRIAVGESGTIHVFFPANETSEVTGLDVVTAQYTRSTDGGRNFEPARTINRPVDFDRTEILGEGLSATFSFGTMGLGPNGTVYTAWQDIGEMTQSADGANAHMAISRDDGRTFTTESAAIDSNDVCPCCQLTLAFTGDDVLLGYRKLYADGRDSTIARSSDGGATFSHQARVPLAPWDINGCPLKPTEMAVDGERVYTASYTGGEDPPGVYFTRSEDSGNSFQPARQLHPGADYSDAPELSVAPDGTVTIVWQSKADGVRRLFVAESADGGQSLSAPKELPTPAGGSAFPATDVGPDGSVYVTWQQDGEEVFVLRLPPTGRAASR